MKSVLGKLTIGGWLAVMVPFGASAQVTHGMKPDLPKPFSTTSAGNGPDQISRPDGFLPTAPDGFHVNVLLKAVLTTLNVPFSSRCKAVGAVVNCFKVGH